MILTVTPNPALDHTVTLEEPLVDGAVARTDEARLDAGGKGINVSLYLQALGVPTAATGFLGPPLGEVVRTKLAEQGIDRDFVTVRDSTRLNTTVLTPGAEYKINHDGPTVRAADVDDLLDAVADRAPETLVVGGSFPPGVGPLEVDQLAATHDGDTVVDVGGEHLAALDGSYALCKPNREELATATGLPTETVQECVQAADALRETGFESVLASLGPDGAVLVTGSGVYRAESPATDVVDTVGAGDSLLAGYLAARSGGRTQAEALGYAVTVAARVVGVSGTQVPSFGDLDDASRSVRVEAL